MYLKAENKHLRSSNKELKGKLRSLSGSKRRDRAGPAEDDDEQARQRRSEDYADDGFEDYDE